MKKLLLLVVFALFAAGYLLSQEDNRWFALHWYKAEPYAQKLLAGKQLAPPGWAAQMLISSNKPEQIVMFAPKGSQFIFAYSPYKFPRNLGRVWSHEFGHWYVGLQELK